MSLPAYPGRSLPASYVGRHVPAECGECGNRAYIPPVSFGGREGRCNACGRIVTWGFWHDEPTYRRVGQ